MATESEIKVDRLQNGDITHIIKVDSKLQYSTQPSISDPNDVATKQYVDSIFPPFPVGTPYPAGSADPFILTGIQSLTHVNGVAVLPSAYGAWLDFKVVLSSGGVETSQPNIQPQITKVSGLPDTATIPFGSGGSITIDDYIILVTRK